MRVLEVIRPENMEVIVQFVLILRTLYVDDCGCQRKKAHRLLWGELSNVSTTQQMHDARFVDSSG
jgi:hypothetical protein